MKKATDLGKDKVPFLVLKLAVPSMLAQFVTVLYSIVDRMFIGNIPEVGDTALAGVGVCGPIVSLLTSFNLDWPWRLYSHGHAHGSRKEKQAQTILAHSLYAGNLFGCFDLIVSAYEKPSAPVVWRQPGHLSLCGQLPDHLHGRNIFCPDGHRP